MLWEPSLDAQRIHQKGKGLKLKAQSSWECSCFVYRRTELSEVNMFSICEIQAIGAILTGYLLFTSSLAKSNY